MYPYALLIAIVLELGGGFLFIVNRTFGAHLLVSCCPAPAVLVYSTHIARPVSPKEVLLLQLLFLVSVTPIMHAFWDLPADSPEQMADLINFFKVNDSINKINSLMCFSR